MQQVKARPKACIKFIKKAVHTCQAAMDEFFDPGIASTCYIIIESEESENKATKYVCRWVNRDLLKEDTICTYRSTDTTIENILFKGANNTIHDREKNFITSKLICPQQHREGTSLRKGRQPGTSGGNIRVR